MASESSTVVKVSCVVAECENCLDSKGPDILFHHFPKNPDLRSSWVKNLAQLNNQILSMESVYIICSKHFKDCCYDCCSLKGRFLVYGSVPTIFPRCSALVSKIKPTSVSVPDRTSGSKHYTRVVVPKIPDMRGTADLRFKELLVKSIEKTKKNDQNIIYLDQLIDKPTDFEDEVVNQVWLKKALNETFKHVDYDLFILDAGADNNIDGRTITKLSQISPKMAQNSENFAKIKVLMQHHLQKLCDKEDELKTIHEYQKKLNSKVKEEEFVFDKLQIRKKMRK